jgi:hypothetical protein
MKWFLDKTLFRQKVAYVVLDKTSLDETSLDETSLDETLLGTRT